MVLNRLALIVLAFFLIAADIAQSNIEDFQPKISKSSLSRLIDQPTITSVFQDSKEILWVGTQHGLYRFNGANRRVFNARNLRKDWIPVSDIRGIVEIGNHSIIVATFGAGLFKFNQITDTFEPLNTGQKHEHKFITSIYSGKSGTIWAGSTSSLYASNPGKPESIKWLKDQGHLKKIGVPVGITGDEFNRVYIATSDKLWVIDEVSRTIEAISPLNSGSSSRGRVHITSITYSGKDNVYLGTEDGKILKFQFGQSDVKPVRGELVASTSASVSNLLFHLGYLWIGTSDGLYQFDAANGIIGDFNSRNFF
jgi:ligand-binding sensor domain-containing protein